MMGRNPLKEVGIKSYTIDTDVLLMHVLQIDKNTLLTNPNQTVDNDCSAKFMHLIKRRTKNTPIEYLTGKCEFMSLEFLVDSSTLIPRPDTEILVETILTAEKGESTRGLEIGIGSGCISISLEHYAKNISMHGVDINHQAVQVAGTNYKRVLGKKSPFIISDLFNNVPRGTLFDFIVSNPPYIETDEIERLECNVKDYEPRGALDGGIDGLDFYRKIAEQGKEYLGKRGRIYFEIGYNQARAVQEILANEGYVDTEILNDYADKNRAVKARRV